jgi:hypothetical protein
METLEQAKISGVTRNGDAKSCKLGLPEYVKAIVVMGFKRWSKSNMVTNVALTV